MNLKSMASWIRRFLTFWCRYFNLQPERPVREKHEVIILVHGTGAALRNPADPKWWEAPQSAFARELQNALGDNFAFAEPFCWSGNNSESDRRLAAGRLLVRLREHHEGRHRYHLVGHSHGGSVYGMP